MHIVKTKVLHLGSRKTVLACPKGHKETRVNQAVLPEYKPPVETDVGSSHPVPNHPVTVIPSRPNQHAVQHFSEKDAEQLRKMGGRVGHWLAAGATVAGISPTQVTRMFA
jgi:hypothetical protein